MSYTVSTTRILADSALQGRSSNGRAADCPHGFAQTCQTLSTAKACFNWLTSLPTMTCLSRLGTLGYLFNSVARHYLILSISIVSSQHHSQQAAATCEPENHQESDIEPYLILEPTLFEAPSIIAFSSVRALRRLGSLSASPAPRIFFGTRTTKATFNNKLSDMATLGAYERRHRVTVVGSGNWGSAIAKICAECTKEHPELFEEEVQMCMRTSAAALLYADDAKGSTKKSLPSLKHQDITTLTPSSPPNHTS